MHAKGFSASSEALQQAHLYRFHSMELKYYSMLLWRREEQLDGGVQDEFGSFEDADGYNGFSPSEHYLSTVWCERMQRSRAARLDKHVNGVQGESKWTREDFLQRRQQQVDGTVLKVDASFKLAKLVRVRAPGAAADTKPFHCVVTLFNEFEQATQIVVVLQKALQSGSLRELKQDLKALFVTRYKGGGFKLPRLVSTDECCNDKALLNDIFEELASEGHQFSVTNSVPIASECPVLQLPPDVVLGEPVKANQDSPCLKAAVDTTRMQA
ncbi:unnamed protein product [Ectocarpus sp. CCAP 1310/34]|nr:unnamed protein product [Ectocarpus sp. CCAP 1310/34]